MDTLPPEILQGIFILIAQGRPPDNWLSPIALVCRYWKSLAYSAPALWSSIDAGLYSADTICHHLALSRSLPISVVITDNQRSDFDRTKEVILQNAHRIHSLQFRPTERLSYSLYRYWSGDASKRQLLESLLRTCSTLRRLSLINISLPWDTLTTFVHSLEYLEIECFYDPEYATEFGPTWEAFRAFLSRSPRLQELVLTRYCPDLNPNFSDVAVTLPCLKKFRIAHYPNFIRWMMDHLEVPNGAAIGQDFNMIPEWSHGLAYSTPSKNKGSWPIYAQARSIRIDIPDETQLRVRAWMTNTDNILSVKPSLYPSLDAVMHEERPEDNVLPWFSNIMLDVGTLFADAPITQLIVRAHLLVELPPPPVREDPSDQWSRYYQFQFEEFSSNTWRRMLECFPRLTNIAVRGISVIKALFEALEASPGTSNDMLCPHLEVIALGIDSCEEGVVDAVVKSLQSRTSVGNRLRSLSLEALNGDVLRGLECRLTLGSLVEDLRVGAPNET